LKVGVAAGAVAAVAAPAVAQEKKKVLSPHPPDKTPMFNGAIGFGNLVFLSGRGYHKEGDIKVHTQGVLDDIKQSLEKVGSSMDKVLKCVVYLAHGEDFEGMNSVFKGAWGPEPPVRTTVAVAWVPGNSLVEMDVIAYI
jgi:enamine deaminase RidA (YjgF/YER057c/UK114 family)